MSTFENDNSSSLEAMETLRAVLAEIGWDAWSKEEAESIFIDLEIGDTPIAYAHAAISNEPEQFVFFIVLKLVPSAGRQKECAAAIIEINNEIFVGGFDLDFETGKICFKNAISLRGVSLRPQDARNIILDSMVAVETYLDRIAAAVG